jgi:hypothetical protein
MDSEQKSSEDDLLYFEVDDWFVSKLKSFPHKAGIDIATQIEDNVNRLPIKNGWTQKIGGVTNKEDETIFFEVEYLHQDTEPVFFMDIHLIESDEYLDYINLNKYLKT